MIEKSVKKAARRVSDSLKEGGKVVKEALSPPKKKQKKHKTKDEDAT